MRRPNNVVIAAAALVVVPWAASGAQASPARASGDAVQTAAASCAPVAAGRPRTLLERVPSVVSAQMTPTGDGGAVIAFASYRGSREFPGSRLTVLALDPSGCTRWRASLPGGWPIARPVLADATSIVVAAANRGGAGALAITTLSSATGRVLRADAFASLPLTTGIAPALVADARGDVAALLATRRPVGRRGRSEAVTMRLARPAHATRWGQSVIARSNTSPPAAAAQPDGRMVVGYPRSGRFWMRTGTVAGSLGAPADAGPVSADFRGADVALGLDGTAAAVWESTTYSRPWRLRAAVLPAQSARFAPSVALGAVPGQPGTLLTPAPAAVHVSAGGRATFGFATPDGPADGERLQCANATPAGRFAPSHEIAPSDVGGGDLPAMIFGRTDTAAAVLSTPTPPGEGIVNALVTIGAACRTQTPALIDPAAGPPVAAAIDARDRGWVLGQQRPTVSARSPLQLMIVRLPG